MEKAAGRKVLSTATLSDASRKILDETGHLVLEGILTDDECDEWSAALDDAWVRDLDLPVPSHNIDEPGVRFVRNPLKHTPLFRRCFSEPQVLAGVREVLGPGIILYLINGRTADPGFGLQPLHDLDRSRGRPFQFCNTIWCLDEFTEASGGTRVLPGSHLDDREFLERLVDPYERHPDERAVVAPRGSVIIFNSHLIHGGGHNTSSKPRRSLQVYFALGTYDPYYDWSLLPEPVSAMLNKADRQLLKLSSERGAER